eukprot:SAG22_NODE_1240_length_5042_cov_103.645964_8_plen_280_part_00
MRRTPLHAASSFGDPALIRALAVGWACPTSRSAAATQQQDYHGSDSIIGSCVCQQVAADDVALAVNAADSGGTPPLHLAACGGHPQALKELLCLGAVDRPDGVGATARMNAAELGYADVVKLLDAVDTNGPAAAAAAAAEAAAAPPPLKRPATKECSDSAVQELTRLDVVNILEHKAAFVSDRIAAGLAPTPAQLGGFLRELVGTLGPHAGRAAPWVPAAVKTRLVSIGWDATTNASVPGSAPPAAASIAAMLEALLVDVRDKQARPDPVDDAEPAPET